MIKITKAKDLNDEIKRANYLQEIEKVATTEQLAKLAELAKNPAIVAMLDQFQIN